MKKRLKYKLIALTTSGILFATSAISTLPTFAEDTAAVTEDASATSSSSTSEDDEALTEGNSQASSDTEVSTGTDESEETDTTETAETDTVNDAGPTDTVDSSTADTEEETAAGDTGSEASTEASTEDLTEVSEDADTETVEEASSASSEETVTDESEQAAEAADTEEASAETTIASEEASTETTEEVVVEESEEAAEEITVYYSIVDESGTAVEGAESGSFTFTDSVVLSDMAPSIENYTYEGAYLDGQQVDTLYADEIEGEEVSIEYHYQKDEEQPAEVTEITAYYSVTDADGNPIEGQDGGQFTFSGIINPEEMAPDMEGYVLEGAYFHDEKTDELDSSKIDEEEISLVFRYNKKEEETNNTKTVYTYEDDRVQVTATLSDPNAIPDDAEFRVTELPSDFANGAYLDAANQNAASIDPEAAQAAAEAGTETFTTSNTVLYDIGFFITENGEEKEIDLAEGTVSLDIVFKQDQLTAMGAESGEDVGLVHLPLSNKDAYDTAQDATNITASDIDVDVVDSSASAGADTTDTIDVTLDNLSLVMAYSTASVSLSSYSGSTDISSAAVDSITITSTNGIEISSVSNWSRFNVTVAFSEDDSSGTQKSGLDIESGDTITVSWSSTGGAELTGYSSTINLYQDNDTSNALIATAVVTSTGVTITFNDNVDSLQHVTGSVYFSIYVSGDLDDTGATATITSGDEQTTIDIESSSGTGVSGEFSDKSATYATDGTNTIEWSIWLNEDYRTDLTGTITIVDKLPDTETFDSFVYYTYRDTSGEWHEITSSLDEFISGGRTFTVSGQTITITVPASDLIITNTDNTYEPRLGLIVFTTTSTAEAGSEVTNSATVTYTEDSVETTDSISGSVTVPSSGGTISGLPKGTIQVSKVVEGTTIPIEGITFRVYKLNSEEDSTRVSGWYDGADYVEITSDSDGIASIADLEDGYYEIEEISDNLPNWIAESSLQTIYVTLSGTAGESVSVGNSVVTDDISATKNWVESDGVTDHPTVYFKLYRSVIGGDAEEVTDADILAVTTASGDRTATVTWDDLPLYDNYGNKYTYSVREVDANGNDYTPDGYTKVESGLTVTNIETGDITATKNWVESDGVTADTSDHPTVYFKLYRKISNGDAEEVTDADILAVTTASGDSTATVTWDDLPLYDNSGNEYTYYVQEVDANGNDYTPGGYTKTEDGLTVTNTAESTNDDTTDETDDTTDTSDTGDTTENTEMLFTSAAFSAAKLLDGGAPGDAVFTFELCDEDGNVIDTASNDASGNITFGSITYSSSDIGKTYSYLIREKAGSDSVYTYDSTTYGVTVTIEQTDTSTLDAEVVYTDGTPVFHNTTDSSGSEDTEDQEETETTDDTGDTGDQEETETTDDTEDTEDQEETETTGDTEDTEDSEETETTGDTEDTETTEDTEGTEDQEETETTDDTEYQEITGSAEDTEPVTLENATELRTVHVQKRWADSDDVDGYRPDSITVQLYANEVAYGDPITISADNGWTFDWVNVPKDQFTVLVDYTIEEVSVPAHYTQFIEGDADTGITITNIRAEDGTWGIDDGTGDSYRVLGASRQRVKGASRDNTTGGAAGDTTNIAGAGRSSGTGDAPIPMKWFVLMLSGCGVLMVWTVSRKRRKNK